MYIFRKVLYIVFKNLATTHYYKNPEAVGWRGWIDLPLFGVVAFVKKDNSLLYRW